MTITTMILDEIITMVIIIDLDLVISNHSLIRNIVIIITSQILMVTIMQQISMAIMTTTIIIILITLIITVATLEQTTETTRTTIRIWITYLFIIITNKYNNCRNIIGKSLVDIKIGTIELKHECIIVEGICSLILLWMDVLKRLKVIVNLDKNNNNNNIFKLKKQCKTFKWDVNNNFNICQLPNQKYKK